MLFQFLIDSSFVQDFKRFCKGVRIIKVAEYFLIVRLWLKLENFTHKISLGSLLIGGYLRLICKVADSSYV